MPLLCRLLCRLLCLLQLCLLHVRRRKGIKRERQEASELSRESTQLAAEARLPEDGADRPTEWLSDLAEQVAEEALRRELTLEALNSLWPQHPLLTRNTLQPLLAGNALESLLTLEALQSQAVGPVHPLPKASRHSLTEASLHPLLPKASMYSRAEGSLHSLAKACLHPLLPKASLYSRAVGSLHSLAEASLDPLLAKTSLQSGAEAYLRAQAVKPLHSLSVEALQSRNSLLALALPSLLALPTLLALERLLCLQGLLDLMRLQRLLHLLRIGCRQWIGRERQEPAELSRQSTQLTAYARLAEDGADRAAERLADLAEEITEEALGRELALQPLQPLESLLSLQSV